MLNCFSDSDFAIGKQKKRVQMQTVKYKGHSARSITNTVLQRNEACPLAVWFGLVCIHVPGTLYYKSIMFSFLAYTQWKK
jgi:hypothetical protein